MNRSNPLDDLDQWEDDLLRRYPDDAAQDGFRDYAKEARASVKEFYRLNHRYQSMDFVRKKRAEYLSLTKRRMTIWSALEFLNTLVDDSDPDIDLPQIEHLLQTAQVIRSLSAVPSPTRSSITSSLRKTPTHKMPSTRLRWESTNLGAVWRMSSCHGGTTNILTMSSKTNCPNRRCT